MRTYKEHFVAFLDILGFKAMINGVGCEDIYQIFTEIHSKSRASMNYNGFDIHAYEHLHHKILSDSVIVFIDAEVEDSFPALIDVCGRLQRSLAGRENPILLRGGISKGSLYYEDDIIYGEGLTEAYLLESNLAKYPRIVFTGDTLEAGKQTAKYMFPDLEGLANAFIKDMDALYFLSYTPVTTGWDAGEWKAYFDRLIIMYNNMLNKTTDASLREKYLWLRGHIDYLIDHLSQVKELYRKEDAERRDAQFKEYNERFAIYRECQNE